LLFGRLVSGGRVTVELDDKDQVKLEFPDGDDSTPPPEEPQEKLEVE